MIYYPSPSCFSTRTTSMCYPAQVVNSPKLSDGDSVHTKELHALKPEPSPGGDDIPVDHRY